MSKSDLTRNQKVVFEVLRGADGPLTAYEILGLERVKSQGLKAPLTIYRALEKLLTGGLVHRIESLNAFVACAHEPHSETTGFMICEKCGTTTELSVEFCNSLLRDEIAQKQFVRHKTSVEIIGLCKDCCVSV